MNAKTFWIIMAALIVCLIALSCNDDDDSSSESGDQSDAVWIDTSTDLMWQNDDECCYDWQEAREYCNELSCHGYDDWRLPTISELRSLIRGCEATMTGGTCTVTDNCLDLDCLNDSCQGCGYKEGPVENGQYWPEPIQGDGWYYWSSSKVADLDDSAWRVNFDEGRVLDYSATRDDHLVRCVR